jgi:hypothetical protein
LANHRFRTSTNNSNKIKLEKKRKTIKAKKLDQLRLLKIRHALFKITVHSETAFAAETHTAEGQWLKEHLNMVKTRMFQEGT